MNDQKWRLPEGVDELLPPAAWQLEQVRRQVLDVFHQWGFDYIEPPMVEYLDSLLVGSGSDLDLQTLKVVDQASGRLLGVRADMTSQAARIDAHSLGQTDMDGGQISRLCYAGTVVYAQRFGVHESRVPIKAGAEIYGSNSLAADQEVVALLAAVFAELKVDQPVLVLGHMGIFRGLTAPLALGDSLNSQLFDAVQTKSETDIAELCPDGRVRDALIQLPTLMGPMNVLDAGAAVLKGSFPEVEKALDELRELAEGIAARCANLQVRFDLSELAGFGYHNGPVFSAYRASIGSAIARGGRYDGIGAAFGNARPATGFDVNLKPLVAAQVASETTTNHGIFVPMSTPKAQAVEGQWLDQACVQKIAELRALGERVVCAVSRSEQQPADCNRRLEFVKDQWVVK